MDSCSRRQMKHRPRLQDFFAVDSGHRIPCVEPLDFIFGQHEAVLGVEETNIFFASNLKKEIRIMIEMVGRDHIGRRHENCDP